MPRNLAARLEKRLPALEWQLMQRVAEAAARLQMPLYVVGGLPRDILLGRPANDLDLVVEGDAHELAAALARSHGGRTVVHRAFGTAKWVQGEQEGGGPVRALDLITARSEIYRHPAALPTVRSGTIADDLARRDFTINAIAIRLDGAHLGEVRDDHGGVKDLKAGVVRVLHAGSFIDDPTRMYRAARYEQRYDFRISPDTLDLIPAARPVIEHLSPQRIRHELDLVLDEPQAAAVLTRIAQLGLLAPVHPALTFDRSAARRVAAAAEAIPEGVPAPGARELRWLLWLLPLTAAELETLDNRLHFTAALMKSLQAASDLYAELPALGGLPPSAWAARLRGTPLPAVVAVYLAAGRGPAHAALGNYLADWRHVRPSITGHDLRRLGVPPGAEYQRILAELTRARLDGEIQSEQQEAEYLRGLLARRG